MKQLLSLMFLLGIGAAQATTINAPSTLVGTGALNGNYAYAWGVALAVPAGETITSAQINFSKISLISSTSGSGYLYVDLLNAAVSGVHKAYDGDAAGDYWATKFSGNNRTSVGTQFFKTIGTSLTWSYVLNATELAALNSYLAAGVFNIGLDADCSYTSGQISFTYTLGKANSRVPDVAATAFLMAFGLAGLEVFRRQYVSAKAKA